MNFITLILLFLLLYLGVQLIRTQKAIKINNKKRSLYFATMGHEIKTPLSGAIAALNHLYTQTLNPQQKQIIQQIMLMLQGQLHLMDDLISIEQANSGHLKINRIPCCIGKEIESIINLFTEQAHQKQLLLFFVEITPLPEEIFIDTQRARQILYNLIHNALKFTEQGQIQISTQIKPFEDQNLIDLFKKNCQQSNPEIQLSTLRGYAWLEINVHDSGIGIKQHKINDIFKPFVQVHQQHYSGSGLGLAICAQLIELMLGTIQIKSEENQGTYISVCLPIAILDKLHVNRSLAHYKIALMMNHGPLYDQIHQTLKQANTCFTNKIDESDLVINQKNPNEIVLIQQKNYQQIKISDNPFLPRIFIELCENLLSRSNDTVQHHLPTLKLAANAAYLLPKILLVEDDPFLQQVFKAQLSALNLSVSVADNGHTALEEWNKNQQALIITDLKLPLLDGCEFTRLILAAAKVKVTPVVVIGQTADITEQAQQNAIKSGMKQLFQKPIHNQDIENILKKYFLYSKEV